MPKFENFFAFANAERVSGSCIRVARLEIHHAGTVVQSFDGVIGTILTFLQIITKNTLLAR